MNDRTGKVRWLERTYGQPGAYLTLCLTQADFDGVMRHLKVPEPWPRFVASGANASTHYFADKEGGAATVVCLGSHEGRSAIVVASLLVHEAVHVWQDYLEGIGEKHPGWEMEAYGIQAISQVLMTEYVRRMKCRPL